MCVREFVRVCGVIYKHTYTYVFKNLEIAMYMYICTNIHVHTYMCMNTYAQAEVVLGTLLVRGICEYI